MHYIAARDEHAEQAFLATAKLRSDGTRIHLSSDDHDRLHLFRRADRFLPNGWCMLPPLQSCDKGNACLTCSVFVTDHTHRDVLAPRRQPRGCQFAEQGLVHVLQRLPGFRRERIRIIFLSV